ncbi:nodulation-signaling pathway 1 protein [Iris pallida]|uniref:Nodulation-signaling pathway 1 protein n=1 Tax=Iris pallida TaxID=29817 RepID=A0AAX6I285_IRIPA|nr:nodulation-signaling pathway 1 protein [Iris pallida]KAJ6847359.1 nodulation-signaling pathway 1 protein [Iris pallida]
MRIKFHLEQQLEASLHPIELFACKMLKVSTALPKL